MSSHPQLPKDASERHHFMRSLTLAPLALLSLTPAALGQWSELLPTTSPPSRLRHNMATLPGGTGAEMLMFGGKDCSGCATDAPIGDQWLWNGSDWAALVTATTRPAIEGAVASYSPVHGEILSFSGWNGVGYPTDTWTFDGSDWNLESPTQTPPGRDWSAMAAHPTAGWTVMFGGHDFALGNYDDTWVWDGLDWSLMAPATSPPKMAYHSMAYDGNTDSVVMFGGSGPSGLHNDMWSWDGTNWTQLFPATLPPLRAEASMAWDSDAGVVVMTGGWDNASLLQDTWEWDGSDWRQVTGVGGEDRAATPMVYDSVNRRMVYFGGAEVYSYAVTHARTWEYTNAWDDLGFGLAGSLGEPQISAVGVPTAGGSTVFDLTQAKAVATTYLVAGTSPIFFPLFGGTLVPSPQVVVPLSTDAGGAASFTANYGPGSLVGLQLYFQYWVVDSTGPQGFTASSALTQAGS